MYCRCLIYVYTSKNGLFPPQHVQYTIIILQSNNESNMHPILLHLYSFCSIIHFSIQILCLGVIQMSVTFSVSCNLRAKPHLKFRGMECIWAARIVEKKTFSIPAFCLANSTLSRLATKLLLTSLSVDMEWAQLYSKVLTYPEIIPVPLQHPWLPQLLFRPCFDLLLYRAGRV